MGFGKHQQPLVPALYLPFWKVHGDQAFCRYAPRPRHDDKGKLHKYEVPYGTRMAIDIHPCMRARLLDTTCPLFVTEGLRKSDA